MIDNGSPIIDGPAGGILVVDDDPATATLHRKCLERAGYLVSVARTTEAATRIIAAGDVELVVLDYRLSGKMTGLVYHMQLKQAGYELPVIMVTGFSQEATVIEALRSGVRDFITKSNRYLDYLPEAVGRVLKQVRTERQLVAAEERIRTQAALLDKATNAVFVLDHDDRIEFWNQGAERVYGWTAAEAAGRTTRELLFQGAAPERDAARQAVLAQGEWSGELRNLAKDGREVIVESRWTLVRHECGTPKARGLCSGLYSQCRPLVRHECGAPKALLVIDTDITEKRRLDAHFFQAQRLESVGALAGGIAHEFNNLLQAICGYTKFAMRDLPAGERRYQDLEQVINAADRATLLTRQLLGFSRRQPLDRTVVDPNVVVGDLVKMLRPILGESIELEVRTANEVGRVLADAGQFQQVLLNLCVNARDAMPTGGRLLLQTGQVTLAADGSGPELDLKPGSYTVVSLRDTGCGMTPEVQRRIFEPFFTTKEVGKGTGLGLAMAYGIVQQHNGRLQVESTVGEGSTFKVYLPNVNDEPTTSVASTFQKTRRGTETILVAEDEWVVQTLTVRALRDAGYQTLTAADGEQAVRMFERHADAIALVLMDVVMPKLNGRAAYQRMVAVRPDVRAVFCSGYDPTTGEAGLLAEEGRRLLQKPFDPETLLRTVRDVLDAVNQEEALPCLA